MSTRLRSANLANEQTRINAAVDRLCDAADAIGKATDEGRDPTPKMFDELHDAAVAYWEAKKR